MAKALIERDNVVAILAAGRGDIADLWARLACQADQIAKERPIGRRLPDVAATNRDYAPRWRRFPCWIICHQHLSNRMRTCAAT